MDVSRTPKMPTNRSFVHDIRYIRNRICNTKYERESTANTVNKTACVTFQSYKYLNVIIANWNRFQRVFPPCVRELDSRRRRWQCLHWDGINRFICRCRRSITSLPRSLGLWSLIHLLLYWEAEGTPSWTLRGRCGSSWLTFSHFESI